MNKTRLIFTLAVLLLALSLLFACGKNTESDDTTNSTTIKTTSTVIDTEPLLTTAKEAESTTSAPVTEGAPVTTGMFTFLKEFDSILPKSPVNPEIVYKIPAPSDQGELLAAVSLQGLLAKNNGNEVIVVNYGTESLNYISTAKKDYKCQVEESTIRLLIKKYLNSDKYDFIKGYIITDVGDESINVATSIASQLNALIITDKEDLVNLCEFYGLKCLADVSDRDDKWLRESEYFPNLNKKVGFICKNSAIQFLRDYCIMCGSYCYSDSTKVGADITGAFDFMDDNFVVFGWNNNCGEFGTVEALAKTNGVLVPSDYATNLAPFSAFGLESARQKTEEIETSAEGKHTVVFILSDGDNLQWTLGNYSTSDRWFANKNKGKFYMGWGLPGSLIDVAAPSFEYYYRNMTEKDEFILELSGIGYTYPSKWTSPEALEAMENDVISIMKRTDMDYIEILDTIRFSKSQVNKYYSTFTKSETVKGIFYIDFNNYAAHGGNIVWDNDTPVVSARYRLWAGFTDIEKMANDINSLAKDPKDKNGYTFVTVHAWSGLTNGKLASDGNTLDAVKAVIDLLDENVEVVTPGEFMERIIENNIGK